MKNKTFRYALYFGIGVMLYYVLRDDKKDGGDSLQEIHGIAPWIIMAIVLLMIVLKFVKDRYERRNGGEGE